MTKSYRPPAKRARSLLRHKLISQWNCDISFDSQYQDILMELARDVNSSLANSLFWALKAEDHDRILELDAKPGDYTDPTSYFKDNLLVTLVKKYPHWLTSFEPRTEAMRTFISCEVMCKGTNNSIQSSARVFLGGDVRSVISTASRKIASIIGSCPTIAQLKFEFGPGATFSTRGRTTAIDKLSGALDVTPQAVTQAVELLQSCPGWLSLHGISPNQTDRISECLTIVPGDRLSFVPKTAKTDRPIAIGPTLNVALQKGYGAVLRSRLKRAGLHLNRCPDTHIKLAQKASRTGTLATIDLKSASDTIAYGTVMDLLPFEWFDSLDCVRSTCYQIENVWYPYHKFSAMGNGYTFELESLIFYSLAYASCKVLGLPTSEVSAYGDDIIIPVEATDLLMEVLAFYGFVVNKEKTFSAGSFRESCGGDFYAGIDVRGFYIKERLTLRHIVALRNYLHRTGYRWVLKRTWRYLRTLLGEYENFLAGPDDGTDDHIIFDNYSHLKSFNFVHMSVGERRFPRRWNLGRVFYLYTIYRKGEPVEINPWDTFQQKGGSIPDKTRVLIEICRRSQNL